MRGKILVIEHDVSTGERMAKALSSAQYMYTLASSGREGLACAEREPFDLVVLDAGMPGMNGTNLLCLLHTSKRRPVVVISPRRDLDGIAELLDAGADDYMIDPFEMEELVARIGVQLRRVSPKKRGGVLRHREMTLDPAACSISLCGKPLCLTKQEYRILELMLSFPQGRVFSRQDFFNYAWDSDYVGEDKTVIVHICNIRRKIREITQEPYIETVRGFGVRLI